MKNGLNILSYDTIELTIRSDTPTEDFYNLMSMAADAGRVRGFKFEYLDRVQWEAECWLDNLKFKCSNTFLKLEAGSLAKYYYGSTLTGGITPDDLESILTRLDDDLGLTPSRYSFKDAEVTRIDIAANLQLKYSPSHYIECLPHLPGATSARAYSGKRGKSTGITYTQPQRVLCVYDKIEEMRHTRQKLPRNCGNILRIERRIMRPGGIWKQASTYTDSKKYKLLIDRWKDTARQLTAEAASGLNTTTDMIHDTVTETSPEYALGHYISCIGIQKYKLKLSLAVERGEMSRATKSARLKKATECLALYESTAGTEDNDTRELLAELDNAIITAYEASAQG